QRSRAGPGPPRGSRVAGRDREADPGPVTRKRLRAVFFDAGLTLIHSQPTLAERYIQALGQRDIAATIEEVQAALKSAGALMLEASKADPDIWAADDKVQKHWQDYYINAFRDVGAGAASE